MPRSTAEEVLCLKNWACQHPFHAQSLAGGSTGEAWPPNKCRGGPGQAAAGVISTYACTSGDLDGALSWENIAIMLWIFGCQEIRLGG